MIDVLIADTVPSIARATMDRVCQIRGGQVDMVVMVRAPQTVIMIITAEEIDIAETDIARPLIIVVEVTEMTTTEITLVIETGVIMITTTEAVQGVVAEVETDDEKADEIAGRGLAGIDLEIGTKGEIEIGLERDTEVGLCLDPDLEIDLVTGPGTDPETEIVIDLAIDPEIEIEKDLAIEEKDTARIIDRVDAGAKAQTEVMTIAPMTGRKEPVVPVRRIQSQTTDLTKEATSLGDAEAVVEVENGAKRVAEESVGLEAKVGLRAKVIPRINNTSHFVFSCSVHHVL